MHIFTIDRDDKESSPCHKGYLMRVGVEGGEGGEGGVGGADINSWTYSNACLMVRWRKAWGGGRVES